MNLSQQDILFLQNRIAYIRDEDAYRKIFCHFHIPLYRFALKIVRNGEIADEIVSDVLMKIWSMGHKLAQVDRLRQYLFTAVKNAAFTALSGNKPEKIFLDSVMENSIADQADNPENLLILSEVDRKIESAIAALPPHCQMVYRLIKEEGFSHKEVCNILEISQNTVETHMRIALKKIRLALDNYLIPKNK